MKAALRGLLLSRLSIGELRSVLKDTLAAKKSAGKEVSYNNISYNNSNLTPWKFAGKEVSYNNAPF